jgi:hypothetical protein
MSKSRNTTTDTPSISNVKRLKELEKARLLASEMPCILKFIDCGNLADLDGCDMALDREQMNGVFLLLDGVYSSLATIESIAVGYGTEERYIQAISSDIDDARKIISLATKLAKVHLIDEEKNEENTSVDVCMVSSWVAGFLASLRVANELYVIGIYHCVHNLIEAIPAPSEGGGNAHDSLH